ncbi:hypothetical protein HNP84_001490 [Thermocatellispora tengchongensis]|uniref:Uncharacterized protein n=1 Tax=Thermocatellispora tengchongensis TaxID=1073253 RepID=A0A840P3F3_9ACTN|nr:hypothetical protein [Thermocatellispora tengchongensis]MBB5131777.1 hypothetical protein [Thermocatellispora tengchongensis]
MSTRTRLIVAAVVCALVAGGGAYLLLGRGDPPRAAVFTAETSTAIFGPIAGRALDPEPLTVQEVFAAAELTSGDTTLSRKGTETLPACQDAVWGDAATAAVAACTQALRAVYATADGMIAAQSVIFNLPDSAAADRLVRALGPGGGFVHLAEGVTGFDAARSRAQARALGHYVALNWVAPASERATPDLTQAQIALDSITRAMHDRVVAAT